MPQQFDVIVIHGTSLVDCHAQLAPAVTLMLLVPPAAPNTLNDGERVKVQTGAFFLF